MENVFQSLEDDMWYFYDRQHQLMGPYETEDDAWKAHDRYYLTQ